MKKSVYKSAMSNVKTSDNFKEETYRKLVQATERSASNENKPKEKINMEYAKKRTLTGWAVGAAACAVLAVSIFTVNQSVPTPIASPLPSAVSPAPSTSPQPQPSGVASKPPITTGKAAVNIEGVITEVSEDGQSFKVGDLWVTVTPETAMGIDGPTAAEPSEELLQKEFKVGNIVSGFTTEDTGTGKVNATRIYNNMAPSK